MGTICAIGAMCGFSSYNPASVIYAIYAGGAVGTFYDPSDLSTIYQDSAGVTAGLVGQTEGLVLDKSRGLVLGSNISAAMEAANWTVANADGTHIATFSGGTLRYQSDTISPILTVSKAGVATAGKFYAVTITVSAWTSGGIKCDWGNLASAAGTFTYIMRATNNNLSLYRISTNVDLTISSLTVRELAGNHAYQDNSGLRGLLKQTAGGKYYTDFDGVDDYEVTAAGGGGTTGFFFCAAILPEGGAGANRTIISDAGANIGYAVRLNTSNQLEISAGNGAAFTTIATADTASVGTAYVVTAWDDGANLNVQINNGTVAQTARPVVSAGTSVITVGKDNGAASGYFNGGIFNRVYVKNGSTVTESQREQAKRYVAARAGVTL